MPQDTNTHSSGTKTCPRCGATFLCQTQLGSNCQCVGIELSPDTRAMLNRRYPYQCLCRACLLEFSKKGANL